MLKRICLLFIITFAALAQNTEPTYLWTFSAFTGKAFQWMTPDLDVELIQDKNGDIQHISLGQKNFSLKSLKGSTTLYNNMISLKLADDFSAKEGGEFVIDYAQKGEEKRISIYIEKFDDVWIPYSYAEGSYLDYDRERNQEIDMGNFYVVDTLGFSWDVFNGIKDAAFYMATSPGHAAIFEMASRMGDEESGFEIEVDEEWKTKFGPRHQILGENLNELRSRYGFPRPYQP